MELGNYFLNYCSLTWSKAQVRFMKAFGGFQESRSERPDLKLVEFTGSLL